MATLIFGKRLMFPLRRARRGRGFDRLGCEDFGGKWSRFGEIDVSVGFRSLNGEKWSFTRGLVCVDVQQIRYSWDFVRNSCLGFCSQPNFGGGHSINEVEEDDLSGDGASDEIGAVNGSGEFGKDDEELVSSIGSGLKCLDDGEKCTSSLENRRSLQFLNEMVSASAYSLDKVLHKWTTEYEDIGQGEIYMAAIQLQKLRMYVKALKLMEWLESTHRSNLAEEHYACHLHLICKVYGLEKSERYMNYIPLSFQGEMVYRTLLANCVIPLNLEKAETVFNKMRDLQLPLSSFACNQMIMLYKRLDVKKIVSILFLMKKENIKPSAETYHLLIDTKGEAKDIVGMEQLVKVMKSEGIEPDTKTYFILAKHYVSGGFKDKALDIMRKVDAVGMKSNPRDRCVLLSLFALLGNDNEVARIWKECELDPIIDEHVAAIEAWGRLGQVAKAEAVFEKMYKKWKRLSSRHYSALLNIYVDHKLLTKGREFVKRMGDTGCWIGPLTRDALVRLFLGAGDVEKAASILQKVSQGNRMRPMFQSYMCIMEQYAILGDIHNTEKIFQQMRQSGYIGRLKPFELLIQAYINAQSPAYGFLERMKAENVSPNKIFAAKLAKANAFMYKEAPTLLV